MSEKILNKDGLTHLLKKINETKANINNPVFTGIPEAPTAGLDTKDSQIATTKFVHNIVDQAVFSAGGSAQVIITITPATTATVTLTNKTTGNIFSAETDISGVATLNITEYGVFNIKYKSAGAISSDKSITITTPGKIYQISAKYATSKVYTVDINLKNSNPLTSVTYADDAIGMIKGSSDWDENIIFKDIKPCIFKDGQVVYYLNKDDITKKENGEDAKLDGTDGDVMIEFPKFAYKIWKESDNSILHVSITNNDNIASENNYKYYAFSKQEEGDREYFYWGAFKGSLDSNGNLQSIIGQKPANSKTINTFKQLAQNKGEGYTITSYFQLIAIQCLYLIKYGNLNGQNTLGKGISERSDTVDAANYGPIITGGTTTFEAGKKMYYGNTSNGGSSSDYEQAKYGHIKFAGIEDFWGNIWEWIDGLITDSQWNIITNWDYDKKENNEDFTFTSNLTQNSGGFVTDVSGTTETGFMNIKYGGSSTTFFSDYGWLCAGCVLQFGGRWSDGSSCGPFYLNASGGPGGASVYIGARLMFL